MQNVVIIGSGPSGLTAGIYCARAKLKPIIISGIEDKVNQLYPGGQLVISDSVENFPGFPDPVSGKYLTQDLMMTQAVKYGSTLLHEEVTKIEITEGIKSVITTNKRTIETRALIVATGASSRWLKIANEEKYMNNGVSTCAVCDATPALNDKHIVVVGGGDSAMEDALYLTKYSQNITIIHRRDQFRASKVLQERILSNKNIKVIWDSVVTEYEGNERLESLTVKNVATSEVRKIKTSALFIAIGHIPNTRFLKDSGIELDTNGYIVTKQNVFTNKEGVFASGDVHDTRYRQAITASGFGCMSALEAERWINEKNLFVEHPEELQDEILTYSKEIQIISYDELLSNIKNDPRPIVLEARQVVCPLCIQFSPILSNWIDKYPEINFLSLNVDQLDSHIDDFEDEFVPVYNTPTFIFIKNGEFYKKYLPNTIKDSVMIEEIITKELK